MHVVLRVEMGESLRVHVVSSTALVRSDGNVMLNKSKMMCRDVQGRVTGGCVSVVSGSLCPFFTPHLYEARATSGEREDLFFSTEKRRDSDIIHRKALQNSVDKTQSSDELNERTDQIIDNTSDPIRNGLVAV